MAPRMLAGAADTLVILLNPDLVGAKGALAEARTAKMFYWSWL